MEQPKSKGANAKAWRERMERENPEYMDLQRAKARERSRARYDTLKSDPAFRETQRISARDSQRKRRADSVTAQHIREVNRQSRLKPENAAKQAERMSAWRAGNKDEIRSYQASWRKQNAESVQAYNRNYMAVYNSRPDVKDAARARQLDKDYGISMLKFTSMWDAQNGLCAICEIQLAPTGKSKNSACVDHNHDTGEVRGLLCRQCNNGIGCLKDSPDVMRKAAAYLQERGHYGTHQMNVRG